MSRVFFLLAVLAISLALSAPEVAAGDQNLHSYSFNWLRDADGDGIPNCEDDDWTPPLDGTGYGLQNGIGIVLPGMYISLSEEGNLYRKQKRNQYDRDANGDSIMERKRLRDGSCQ